MDTPQHGSILPEGMNPEGLDIKKQAAHRYAAIHIEQPFDNPFSTIPGAYHTLGDYMRTNGLVHVEDEVIPCFETARTHPSFGFIYKTVRLCYTDTRRQRSLK